MSVKLNETKDGRVLEVMAHGQLTRNDYQEFLPAFERLQKVHGKVSVLFQMEGFHGWEPGALWEDIKFDARHYNDIERIAMVGDKRWEKMMATVCKPFTSGTVRYFDQSHADEAREWVGAT